MALYKTVDWFLLTEERENPRKGIVTDPPETSHPCGTTGDLLDEDCLFPLTLSPSEERGLSAVRRRVPHHLRHRRRPSLPEFKCRSCVPMEIIDARETVGSY